MKRKIMFGAATVALVLGFSSCELLFDTDGSGNDDHVFETVEATTSQNWDVNSNKIIKINPQTLTVNMTGNLSGKTLYLVQNNPTEYTMANKYLRAIKESSTQTVSSAAFIEEVSEDSSRSAVMEDSLLNKGRKHFVGEKLPEFGTSASRSAIDSPSLSVTQIDPTVGTTKNIYVDTDTSMSTYTAKASTLRAVGTYCNVWVVDSYYSTTASGNKVNTAIAEKYAAEFDKMYPVITKVFGNESDKIIDYDKSTNTSVAYGNMSDYSDTGTKINIVVYDIANDYKNADNVSSVGVVGYFYAKDYYYTKSEESILSSFNGTSIIYKSNVGKYFYIDSGYANSNFNDTISTLAHEFQHMINFNMKDITHNQTPDTSYNEMLSMLCEDMMQEFLGLEDDASPKNRTQSFNLYYYYSGIREYRNDDYAALSYSTSYIFGAWLCRQYGGAELVKAMMSNAYVDSASIVAAVNSVNGTSYTFEDLFKQFLLSLFGDSTYTHNKDAAKTLSCSYTTDSGASKTYTYPMTAFNIFDSEYSPYEVEGFSTSQLKTYASDIYKKNSYKGPFLYKNSIVTALRPNYGILLHSVLSYTSGTSDTLTFTSTGAKDLEIYLILE